jgi:hypothetical protein
LAIVGAASLALCAGASADIVERQDFEGDPSTFGGWLVNGDQMTFDYGHPGTCIGVPYLDFWGITLRNDTPGSSATGDLTRYQSDLRIGADVIVVALDNWFGQPMDPGQFPIVLEFVDYDGATGPVSVYYTGPGMPRQDQGWARLDFLVPDPSSETLPPGWGGTGDEDPVTYEPRLPPGRTYRNVMNTVDEVRITTMRPGYFYSSSFWQAAFDNVFLATVQGAPCNADYNHDGFVDGIDYDLFNNDFESGQIAADYNNDGFVDGIDYDTFNNDFEVGC